MSSAQFQQFGPFFDGGVFVTGAKLYACAAGTTTQKYVWYDQAMTTTAPFPMVANANGLIVGFFDGLYKLIIARASSTGPADNVLEVWDNYNVFAEPTITETWINVQDEAYGAVGDGLTDDTAAINAALAVLDGSGLGDSAKRRLFFPGGDYVVTSALTPVRSSQWEISGYGARILAGGSGSYTVLSFGGTPPITLGTQELFNVHLRGLSIVKTGTGTLTGIKAVGLGSGSSFHDVGVYLNADHAGDIAWYLLGHNETGFMNIYAQADKPIVFGNASGLVGDGVDHFNFHNLALFSTTNASPLVSFDADAAYGALSFTGHQIWIGGNAGFSYGPTAPNVNPGNLYLENIRREDNTAPTNRASGYSLDIQAPTGYSAQMVNVKASQFSYGTAINGTAMDGIRLHSDFVHLVVDTYHDGGGTGQSFLEVTGNGNAATDQIVLTDVNYGGTIALTNTTTVTGPSVLKVVATADLPVAAAAMNGTAIIEDNGAGDRNLILYAGGQRFRIDGGANV